MSEGVVQAVHEAILLDIKAHNIPKIGSLLDQLLQLPKELIYSHSYESLKAEAPTSSTEFLEILSGEDPTTTAGQKLKECIYDLQDDLEKISPYELAKIFILNYMSRLDGNISSIRYGLFLNSHADNSVASRNCLNRIRLLWLVDPDSPFSPNNRKDLNFFKRMDPASLWAWWNRQLMTPIFIDEGGKTRAPVSNGYIYDLRSMAGFEAPTGDISQSIKLLLQEADLLRTGSIPPCAYVEINFPPFVALVFEEFGPYFIMVEALDATSRSLPLCLFPSMQSWSGPNAGAGPSGDIASFENVVEILAAMAAAAVRDFWIVEDRERVLGPPRVGRIAGSKSTSRKVIYLPRIRYTAKRNIENSLEKNSDIKTRAAHWRSAHFRKLPLGQKPTKKQLVIARSFGQQPPQGQTWVRGTSVLGLEVEQIYRSRSISKLLFDVVPSKGQALSELSWFGFEKFCASWLRERGFDEVSRAVVDRGVDITALKDHSGVTEEWVIQCKHWKDKVGPHVVRELEGAKKLRSADHAILITSSAFTVEAINTAKELKIELVDGDQLQKLI